jgi:hypothetical protein
MTFRRVLLAAGGAFLLSGCAAGPALFGPPTGDVTGQVTVRSCGGANSDMQPACQVNKAAGARIAFQLDGTTTSQVATTNSDGVYVIQLKPGTYQARLTFPRPIAGATLMPNDSFPRGLSGPKTITVAAGKTVHADFSYAIMLL